MTEENEPPQSEKSRPSNNILVAGLKYAHMGLILPVSVVIGWFLGSLIDGWAHTTWVNRAGLAVGIVAGFYELIRTAMKMGKES